MKAKKGFNLRTICGRQIIVAFLWEQIGDKDFTIEDLVCLLTTHYDVSEAEARKDVEELVKKFLEIGIIEE